MNGVEIFFLLLLLVLSLSFIYGEKDISDSEDSIFKEKFVGIVILIGTSIWVYVQAEWLFWVGIVFFIAWRTLTMIKSKEIEKEDLANKLRKKEKEKEKEREESRKRQNDLKKLYEEKIQELTNIQEKNKQLKEEIQILKPIVSNLSIYDDDFLEQQPKVLEYIEEVINLGRI